MNLQLETIASLALAATGLLALVVGLRAAARTELSARLREFVDPQAQRPLERGTPTIRAVELSGSFRQRVLFPAFTRLGQGLGRLTPAAGVEQLRHQLALAGNPWGLGPREFYGLRLVFLFLGVWLALGIARGSVGGAVPSIERSPLTATAFASGSSVDFGRLGVAIAALYLLTRLPKTWISRRARLRQDRIRRGLPDALDMLSVCADAGLGFDQALQRVSERWLTPLGAEFGRVVAEMGMGTPRQRALRNLAERTAVPELASFVAVIVQSDQLGMSIAQTLRAQAEQMRVERRFRAQEEARKAPLKMLFPMLLLIFPAMFAVILGPSVPVFAEFFDTLLK